jgi:hypothetical protein
MHVPTFTYAPAIEPVNIRLPHRLSRVRHVEVRKNVRRAHLTQVPSKKLLVLLCKLSVCFRSCCPSSLNNSAERTMRNSILQSKPDQVRTDVTFICASILKNYWTKDRTHCHIIMSFRMIRCPGCSEPRSLDVVCTVGGSTRSGTRPVDPSSELDESFFFF